MSAGPANYGSLVLAYVVGSPLGGIAWHYLQYVTGVSQPRPREVCVRRSSLRRNERARRRGACRLTTGLTTRGLSKSPQVDGAEGGTPFAPYRLVSLSALTDDSVPVFALRRTYHQRALHRRQIATSNAVTVRVGLLMDCGPAREAPRRRSTLL